jgi:type IV secretion system protein VirB10
LAALPKDYGQTAPPKLGPPLPGDLGRAIVHRQGAVETTQADAQAAAAERERLAAQARQAREAGVMVRMGKGDAASQTAMELSNLPIGAPPLAQALSPAFLDRPPSPTANGHVLTEPASPFQVMAGDTIAATLLTGLDSGLPGFVTAQVSQNVYDTVSGRFLLIPQGARLIGEYDSTVAFGQSRILLAWRRLILPDGSSIELDNLPATDSAGYAGLKDTVDFHGPALAKAAALSTLLGVGSQLAMEGEDATIRTLRRSAQQSASTVGEQIVGKQLSVRPTLKIRPGFPLRVIVHKDLTLRPWRAS